MGTLWETAEVLGPSPNFPLSARRAASCTRNDERFPVLDPTSDSGYLCEFRKGTANPLPRSTPAEAELSARCAPSLLAPCKASRPAPGRGWCSQPDKVAPGSRPRGCLLPASPGRLPSRACRLPRAERVPAPQNRLQPRSLSETRVAGKEPGSGDHQLVR